MMIPSPPLPKVNEHSQILSESWDDEWSSHIDQRSRSSNGRNLVLCDHSLCRSCSYDYTAGPDFLHCIL